MSKTFPLVGGVHPPENKQQSLQAPLRICPVPERLVLPLNQHIGAAAEAIVEVGDTVLAGQCIAAAKGMVSAPIHASSSGTVVAIEDHPIPHASGLSGPCIIIETDGQDRWQELEECSAPFELSNQQILDKIRSAGIAGMGGAGFPAAVKLNPPPNSEIDTLIINGTECEPYITADDILMQQRADDIIQGTLLLAQLLGQPQRVVIGVEDNKPEAIAALTTAANGQLEICSFPTKYPSGGEKQLIYILTGREVPSKKLPAHIGVVLQNVGTTAAIWGAVRHGRPLVSRITTVVGNSLSQQGNAEVRIGTPIKSLLKEFGFKAEDCSNLIAGGPMMGFSLEDLAAPIVKTSNCLLAPDSDEMPAPPPAQACIRCGICAEACPASLLPQQLYWYSKAQDHDRLQSHNLMDCIECGACSFVCPSNIPLVQYYRASKGDIRQAEVDKVKSDRSRQRFEFRQHRIDKAEAEKEAKRQARKQAAELAKQKAAAKASTETATNKPATNSGDDLVAAAMARVQTQQTDPAEQLAKLERAVNNASTRQQSAQQKLNDAEDNKKEQFAARLKQAEVRVADATKKLTQFKQQQDNEALSPTPTQATTDPATANSETDSSDPVAAAIARAQAKMSMSPTEKHQANLESLSKRLASAEQKIAAAQVNNEPDVKIEALKTGASKLEQKISVVRQELTELEQQSPEQKPAPPAEQHQDAAAAAIEKAKQKAAAQANLSDEDKRLAQIESLKQRLGKAQARLAKAESDNDENLPAFKAGAEKIAQKLADMEQQ